MLRGRLDGLTVVAIAFFIFLVANVVRDHFPSVQDLSSQTVGRTVNTVVDSIQSGSSRGSLTALQTTPAPAPDTGEPPLIQPVENGSESAADLQAVSGGVVVVPGDPNAFGDPYDNYIVTQGPHGMSYGHYAVDITAGNGETIKSPINGIVSSVFIDQYNNTTLIIENERYQVLMLHGDYTVHVGQVLAVGDPVGTESNHGYTLDANGRLCAGRDCGYHTHLNVFDKSINSNVDPFTLLSK
jgi:hypothetical protein